MSDSEDSTLYMRQGNLDGDSLGSKRCWGVVTRDDSNPTGEPWPWCYLVPVIPAPKSTQVFTMVHLVGQDEGNRTDRRTMVNVQRYCWTPYQFRCLKEDQEARTAWRRHGLKMPPLRSEAIPNVEFRSTRIKNDEYTAMLVSLDANDLRWVVDIANCVTPGAGEYTHTFMPRASSTHGRYPLSVLVFNCKWGYDSNLRWIVAEMKKVHNPSVVMLTETNVGGENARNIIGSLEYHGMVVADPGAFVGGMGLVWNDTTFKCDVTWISDREIQVQVKAVRRTVGAAVDMAG